MSKIHVFRIETWEYHCNYCSHKLRIEHKIPPTTLTLGGSEVPPPPEDWISFFDDDIGYKYCCRAPNCRKKHEAQRSVY